nr:retrovirus-related Pol polyprotein from transposon TNT 1-94 [Tanacetum cinerariifolium]
MSFSSIGGRSKDSPHGGFKPLREEEKKDAEDLGNEDNEVLSTKEPRLNQEKDVNVNNTNNINAISPTTNAANTKDNPVDENIKNKKDKKGFLVRNKSRLVAQGYTQEERIDYDEVFAPVARIETIRLFLAYASFKNIVVYQMDVKSAFLYGKIEKEVYVYQPPGFEDLEFPERVYKVEKVLYGLHQAPKAWKENCTEFKKMMHKKF